MTTRLSVVVVPLAGDPFLERCLTALSHQRTSDTQIIVAYDDSRGSISRLQNFPEVQFLKLEGSRTYAELRSAGFRAAEGRIIALTEDQCIPDPDWCANILKAHETSYPAIGGAVDKAIVAGESMVSWSIYFCDYSRYSNPVRAGIVPHLTDCNVSYKSEALKAIREVWDHEFHETVVHRALQRRGEVLWISPEIVVKQQRSITFTRAIHERFSFGRLFGSTRVADLAILHRILFALAAILLPVLLTARIATNIFAKKRYRFEFVRCLPVIVILNCFWSLGECVGYLTAKADE